MSEISNLKSKPTPVLVGNGDICLMPDEEGTLYESPEYAQARKTSKIPIKSIYRAGRRMYINPHKKIQGNLLPFGHFSFDCGSKIKDYEQSLELPDGFVKSTCRYEDGSYIDSTYFVHYSKNIYVLRKIYHGKAKEVSYEFVSDFENRFVKTALRSNIVRKVNNGYRIGFSMEGMGDYTGSMTVFTDYPSTCTQTANDTFLLSMSVNDGDAFTFYYMLEDDFNDWNPNQTPISVNPDTASSVDTIDFNSLLSEHKKLWNCYFERGYIKTADQRANDVHMTALYHLKCTTTKWSIPVGINDYTWHGNYFAFDEYYGFYGLLSSGQFELAKRVPAFRVRNCLKKAISRATSFEEDQARFMWETIESGDENAPLGHWMDHVFHMAVIALGAYQYYEYTKDREFLAECYDMIRACAQFYVQHMIYEDSTRGVYFGKCTDLERLGSSIENPFMSSCGAIKTFRVLVNASKVLDIDDDFVRKCSTLAEGLLASLPQDEERYLPFAGTDMRSIGVFSAKFPFDILDGNDPKLQKAFSDYVENEKDFGNMYRIGSGVSPWYCAWKAEGYARCGMANEAEDVLLQARKSAGKFGEMYEINEEDICKIPWFMTAAGIYLSAVNESVIQSDGENIYLLPASNETNISFKLPVKGGAVCKASFEDGKIKQLKLKYLDNSANNHYRIYYRGKEVYVTQ